MATRKPNNEPIDPGALYRQVNIFVAEQRSDKQKAADKAAADELVWLVASSKRKYENRLASIGIVILLLILLMLGVLYGFGAILGFL